MILSIYRFISLDRQLKWIIKGAERLETLVSISTDGRVLEWNLKKGLVVSMLMQLKKSGTVCMLHVVALWCPHCDHSLYEILNV